ncbi:unnamed protein product, partial [Laminaria digitata]
MFQAAFRGYRLRYRLRRLPAREAERTVRALHANAHGFRRIALFLVFMGLFFSLVFSSADVVFQRSVHQGLEHHLSGTKYGPEKDRTHTDVTSLCEVFLWMQAFYLKSYVGTELENLCSACVAKPPDDVCNACDFDIYDETIANQTIGLTSNSGSISADRVRRRSATAGSSSSSNNNNSNDSSGSSVGLSEECEACVVGRFCTGQYLELCAASLNADSSTSPPDKVDGNPPGDVSSASSSGSSAINATALNALVLEPAGGVSAAGGHLLVDNLLFNGLGFVADRNRIIGGMLITFSRRMRLSEEKCEASRGYFDVCLADEENKEPIIPGGAWAELRPDFEIKYNEVEGGYSILIDTGGYNTGLNRGLCALLMMEDLDIIPPEEVKSVSVQLVTYNGNLKSAFGSIFVDFSFDHGGQVTVTEAISAYVLKRNLEGSRYSRWCSAVLFVVIFVGMVWHDMSKWWHLRRSKAKRNCWHCLCGFTFFALVFVNIVLWLVSGGVSPVGSIFALDVDVAPPSCTGENPLLADGQVVALHNVALFVSTYYFVFLLTTMAGLYRWIFQMLTFHKRMSVVADTLSGSSTHLHHILLVAFLVALVFTNLTWLLVGSHSEEFSTPGEAWRSVTRVSLGEYENFYPQILEAQPTVGPVIVVVYQVLGVVLLLNVVIAVLLEAYRVVVVGMQNEDTILQSLVAFVGMTLCMGKARMQWTHDYVQWWLSDGTSRHERRPSLKLSLQGPNSVCGVDGRPVLLIRRSSGSPLTPTMRQLSFNCPRYISV